MKKNIFFLMAVILCMMLTACTSNISEPEAAEDSVAIFATEDDMINCIQGSYIKLDAEQLSGKSSFLNDNWMEQIIIDGTSYTYIYYNAPSNFEITETSTIVSYSPQEGKFTLLSDKTKQYTDEFVLNNGISINRDKYGDIRIAYAPDSSSGFVKYDFISFEKFLDPYDTGSSKADKYETMYSALAFSELNLTSKSGYSVLTGKITNNGKHNYEYIKIKGLFKDESGTVIDTDWTYGIGTEGLAPGESTSFRLSVKDDWRIQKASVELFE